MINRVSLTCRQIQAHFHNEDVSTTEKYYLSHDAKQLDEEKLAQIMETLDLLMADEAGLEDAR
jgi:hypothetical protein